MLHEERNEALNLVCLNEERKEMIRWISQMFLPLRSGGYNATSPQLQMTEWRFKYKIIRLPVERKNRSHRRREGIGAFHFFIVINSN